MRKFLVLFSFIFMVMLSGCRGGSDYEQYSLSVLDTFDTNINIIIYDNDKDRAMKDLKFMRDEYSRLNDIYDCTKSYPDVVNVKSINDMAGVKPVKVDKDLYNLIKFAVNSYYNVSEKNNIAMGPVVDLWNEYRSLYNNGLSADEVKRRMGSELPLKSELESLRYLTDMNNVVLNDSDSTVFLKVKGMKLDLGAVAKGYATELIAKEAMKRGVSHGIINAGGNVRLIGSPADGRDFFKVAIESPYKSDDKFLTVLRGSDESFVTSSDNQRFFVLNGKVYCHIIDPDTLMPGDLNKSVTVIAKDSAMCDFLSTAMYLMPYDEGLELSRKMGFEAVWALPDGDVKYTEGAKGMVVSE